MACLPTALPSPALNLAKGCWSLRRRHSGLTEITLPKGLVYLGERAFYSCALHSITFPDRKVSVGENVFDFCEELSVIRTTKAMADYYEAVFGGWYEYDVEGGR